MLTFEWPQFMWLLPLPFILRLLLPALKSTNAAVLIPENMHKIAITSSNTTNTHTTQGWGLALLTMMWLSMVCAAANPLWHGEAVQLPTSGRDLLLAVDISGSMETPDMLYQDHQVNRLQTVKAVVSEFVERRKGDRLGLILFGTNAYLQAPLTFDRKTVEQLLQEAQLGFAGEKTAIGDAIGLAIKRLRNRPESSRVLILLTDGANTAGNISPQQAAKLAAAAKVKIYTIGLGADQLQMPGLLGSQFGARTVNPSIDLDEKTLNLIATSTGGQYFRARDPNELFNIYALLDKLEPASQEGEIFRPQTALFYWPLGLALLFSVLSYLIRNGAFLRSSPHHFDNKVVTNR